MGVPTTCWGWDSKMTVGQQNDSKNIYYPAHLFEGYGCVRWVFARVVRVGRVNRQGVHTYT